jgi:colanic acid/amylovoran biosynthesis glycosyltransferase
MEYGVIQRQARPRLCIIQDLAPELAPPFIVAHAERLPAQTLVVHGFIPHVGNRPLLSQSFQARVWRKAWRTLRQRKWEWEHTAAYLTALRTFRPAAVLAEFGPVGVRVMEACRLAGVPLIAHFHGVDASEHGLLQEHAQTYPALFRASAAVIAVSRAMERKLLSLGVPSEKLHYNPYGVDCRAFAGAQPGNAPPVFVAVGRFVDKKAPALTLAAFAKVHQNCAAARLRMIGDGPLYAGCRALAASLGIEAAVTFLGNQSHTVVQEEMRRGRAFVQHSIEAPNGDCEGTPVAIIEACATALPVVSTRHAGIPDVVLDGQTGFLVEERDVEAMADRMLRLAQDPVLAATVGQAAQQRIRTEFTIERSHGRLWSIIESHFGPARPPVHPVPDSFGEEASCA